MRAAAIQLERLKTTVRWSVGSAKVGVNIFEYIENLELILIITKLRGQLTYSFYHIRGFSM